MSLIREKRPQGGTRFDLLIDRLNRFDEARLPEKAAPSFLMALANCMDRAGLEEGKGQKSGIWSRPSAKILFQKLVDKLSGIDRDQVIPEVFTSGKAIGWLMSKIVRGEVITHGRVGDKPVPEEEGHLSNGELDNVIEIMLERFRSTDRSGIIATPAVLDLMYSWMEVGDESEVLEWVQEQQTTDDKFLELLSACRGWSQSDKIYYPLNRRDLKKFLDFDEAIKRLETISNNSDRSQGDRALADELLKAAELGKDD